MDYSYTIIDQVDVTDAMVDVCEETAVSTLRVSRAATPQVVLKWRGALPQQLGSIQIYSESEILRELLKPEWNL